MEYFVHDWLCCKERVDSQRLAVPGRPALQTSSSAFGADCVVKSVWKLLRFTLALCLESHIIPVSDRSPCKPRWHLCVVFSINK